MIEQVSKTFGDWADGAEVASGWASRNEGTMYFVCDVIKDQSELEGVDTSNEYSGWVFVADAAGVDELEQKYLQVEVFDRFGWQAEEEA